jgi:uncharacterized protein (DUF433 family)
MVHTPHPLSLRGLFTLLCSRIDRKDPINDLLTMSATAPVEIGSLITRSPGIKRGAPRVAGTGITVRTIARLHQQGLTPEEIAIGRYHLRLEQVHAALAYYFANREEIDSDMARQAAEIARMEESARTRTQR